MHHTTRLNLTVTDLATSNVVVSHNMKKMAFDVLNFSDVKNIAAAALGLLAEECFAGSHITRHPRASKPDYPAS
jgi:hypothetical protein